MALTADHLDRHRPRPADRRHHGRGVHRAGVGQRRPRPQPRRGARCAAALAGPDVTVSSTEADVLDVTGLTAAQIGDTAREPGLALHELTPQRASLEEAFMDHDPRRRRVPRPPGRRTADATRPGRRAGMSTPAPPPRPGPTAGAGHPGPGREVGVDQARLAAVQLDHLRRRRRGGDRPRGADLPRHQQALGRDAARGAARLRPGRRSLAASTSPSWRSASWACWSSPASTPPA